VTYAPPCNVLHVGLFIQGDPSQW